MAKVGCDGCGVIPYKKKNREKLKTVHFGVGEPFVLCPKCLKRDFGVDYKVYI